MEQVTISQAVVLSLVLLAFVALATVLTSVIFDTENENLRTTDPPIMR
jgi:hypothetical protein